jgi:hypothetical protein
METCPISCCKKDFSNKYALTNHLRKISDPAHTEYYEHYIKPQHCVICNKKIDNRSQYKEGLCQKCFRQNNFIPKNSIEKKYLIR